MIRGTTPTIRFKLPIEVDRLDCLYLTLAQRGTVKVEKCLTDCDCTGEFIKCRLSQADTLMLDSKRSVEIQVRFKTISGDALATEILSVPAGRILKEGEI